MWKYKRFAMQLVWVEQGDIVATQVQQTNSYLKKIRLKSLIAYISTPIQSMNKDLKQNIISMIKSSIHLKKMDSTNSPVEFIRLTNKTQRKLK